MNRCDGKGLIRKLRAGSSRRPSASESKKDKDGKKGKGKKGRGMGR
jgi:hypothetical protein